MTLDHAAELINRHPDLSAVVRGSKVEIDVYGRPAGYITGDDLNRLGHTATGWGKQTLRKGAYTVWQALTVQEQPS